MINATESEYNVSNIISKHYILYIKIMFNYTLSYLIL